jgi:hypothetical protein
MPAVRPVAAAFDVAAMMAESSLRAAQLVRPRNVQAVATAAEPPMRVAVQIWVAV